MQKPVERLLIIAKHSSQEGYRQLLSVIPHVIFYSPDETFNEAQFLALLPETPGHKSNTAIIVDDVNKHFPKWSQMLNGWLVADGGRKFAQSSKNSC